MLKHILMAMAVIAGPLFADDSALGYDEHPEWRLCEIKRYDHWVLSISPAQPTLGTCMIKARRPGVEQIWELTCAELSELSLVMRELTEVMANDPTFQPERFNTFQLCNVCHQLHFHVIPRYSSDREFEGETFEDRGYGGIPVWQGNGLEAPLVLKIRQRLENRFNRLEDLAHEVPATSYMQAMARREAQRAQASQLLEQATEKALADLNANSKALGEYSSTTISGTASGSDGSTMQQPSAIQSENG